MKEKFLQYLLDFVSEHRNEIINKVLNYRTKYITVVLEDIFQSHNASAVLRSCDCFGIQDIHIIENKNKYQINPDVALGATKWLNLIKYNKKDNNTLTAIQHLKNQGYRIIATTSNENDVYLENFNIQKGKVALFFGTELTGLSQTVLNNADECLKIPMYGFTESYNISVSAAIILYHLTLHLRNSEINWKLNKEEKTNLKINWLKNTIKKSNLLEKSFYMEKK